MQHIGKYKRYGKDFIGDLTGKHTWEDLALQIITVDCRLSEAINIKKIRICQHDLIMTKEQSVLT